MSLSRDELKALTHVKRVRHYLEQHRTITPLVAWRLLGVYRLSDVIYKLRRPPHSMNIETQEAQVLNRFEEVCLVACYVLHPKPVEVVIGQPQRVAA